MDWSLQKSARLSAGLGLGLMIIWGLISLADAYESRLMRMGDSFNRAFAAMGWLEEITDRLDRLSFDQQAFFSTRNARFSDSLWQDVSRIEIDLGWLHDNSARSGLSRAELDKLSAAIDLALAAVGQSFDVQRARGKGAAAFYDSEQNAMADAKRQANQMKSEVLSRLGNGVRDARVSNSLIKALFEGVPGAIAVSHRARLLRRADSSPHRGAHS